MGQRRVNWSNGGVDRQDIRAHVRLPKDETTSPIQYDWVGLSSSTHDGTAYRNQQVDQG